uniref:Phospholipid/glycerol acyltransferase domain-containing protein n=1 Tax=Neobodo designis TaxID=312471 RepID=A0A7S1L9E4_NEODS|mmetsp:Transcript_176/g.701  ORF Transcript_176/g.701 Transcript_176/m.701 type:complete len:355 (+) Transcript_176:59-1123(+)
MEKYKRFTDPATGINPFVPSVSVAVGTGRSILALIAAPALAISALIAAVVYAVFGALPYALLGSLASPLHFVAVKLAGHILLASAAWLKLSVVPYPTRASAIGGGNGKNELSPRAGDVVFANLQSPLDPLVLQMAFAWRPLAFVFPRGTTDPSDVADADSVFVESSLTAAMARTLRLTTAAASFDGPATSSKPLRPLDVAPLQRKATRSGRTLVVFPEGATTNGRGLLRMPACVCSPDHELFLAGVAYGNVAHPAPVVSPAASLAGWLFGHCLAWSVGAPSTVDVAVVRKSHRPPVPSAFAGDWAASLQAKLGQAVSFNRPTDKPCRPLASSAYDKERFLCQWGQYNDAAKKSS